MRNKIRDKMNLVGFKALAFLENKKAASNVEIIVWISVVLILALALYAFKDGIVEFIDRAIGRIGGLGVGE